MEGSEERVVLNVDTVAEFWSRTYDTEGKPDWSHIYPCYHPGIDPGDLRSVLRELPPEEGLVLREAISGRHFRYVRTDTYGDGAGEELDGDSRALDRLYAAVEAGDQPADLLLLLAEQDLGAYYPRVISAPATMISSSFSMEISLLR